ncbi:MAG TPA: hypothetical protein PLZ60_07595 [Kiritimatiellia bacterium]|nr:hypothetical protein [Kiritimatiellia bacterium]
MRRVAAARSAAEGKRLRASRSTRAALVRAEAGRSTAVVRVGSALRVAGDVARLESVAGARVVLISGRVRVGAAGSERVTAGRVWTGAARLVLGVRVTTGALRLVSGVRVAGAAGSERVTVGRVWTGAMRLVSGVRAVTGAPRLASPRVVAAGDWMTGARGVATDGVAGRVTTGAVRV